MLRVREYKQLLSAQVPEPNEVCKEKQLGLQTDAEPFSLGS